MDQFRSGVVRDMKTQEIGGHTPLHVARVIASFALLGAVVAGSATIVPAVAAIVPAALDLHAIGALLGGIAGTVTQVARHA